MSKNNSDRRDGYDNKAYANNYDNIKWHTKKTGPVRHDKPKNTSANIFKPFDEFKSNIDGQIISDRGQLREHNRRNGVTNSADYSPEYMDRKRASIAAEQHKVDKAGRIDMIKQVMRTKGYD